jgi:hypothetical protein
MSEKSNLKTPAKPTVRRSPDETTAAALGIINAELAARNKKTAALRALRLGQEPPAAQPKRKAAGKKK